MITIKGYLEQLGYHTVPDETFSHIDEWLEWYQGYVKQFHSYSVYNGMNRITQKRMTMGMAKKVAEDWANLILNEKVAIKAGKYSERLQEILDRNNFRVRGNQLVELTYALGTGAFVEYLADGEIVVDYIRADMIYPISWDNGEITECAFGSYRTDTGRESIYLQIHRLGSEEGENSDAYYIENHLIDAKTGEKLELGDTEEIIDTRAEFPLFQIIVPNIQNNIELDSPMGISVYANAIDQLKGCDLIYDSYLNEFVLGKKRIIVPQSMAKIEMGQSGDIRPIFDPNDTVYYAMPTDRNDDNKITENNMQIRAQEHELGIQRALDLLSLKVGMGTGRYQFDASGGGKTATEVISDKSDLYQNLRKNEIPVKAAVIAMGKAIAFLDGKEEVEVTVDFDDSIMEDSSATIDKNTKLVNAGLRSKLTAIMEIDKCSEEEAQKELERIAKEEQITGENIDWTDLEDKDEQEQKDDPSEKTENREETEKEKQNSGISEKDN